MTKLLFWALDGALARREPEWRLAEGASDALRTLSAAGWTHVLVADETVEVAALLEQLGLTDQVDQTFDASAAPGGSPLAHAIEARRPFDEAFVIGSSLARHIMPAREAVLPSILVGDASPFAQFCVQSLDEVPLALDTWSSMRRTFFV
jgi:phosphoglycolate phosphatase-like HAD superfamily hydrolase